MAVALLSSPFSSPAWPFMARPKLRSPEQPVWLQWTLGAVEFFASLKLAVILVSSAALVLAWATFVESQYGLRAVHFGIYGAAWFTLLNVLLAINIFCAAAVRFPWKRHQTGFVITHVGLLTLMLGTGLSRKYGIDAQMMVWEGSHSWRAYEDTEHFELAVAPLPAGETSAASYDEEVYSHIGFTGGPFNWKELDEMGRFSGPQSPWRGSWADWKLPFRAVGSALRWCCFDVPTRLAWAVAQRDRGVVFDHDNIRLEVLDYFSNATEVHAPHLKLRLSSPRIARQGAEGRDELSPETWVPVELSVRQSKQEFFGQRPQGIGNRESVGGGGITFWLAGSQAEVQSLLDSKPTLPLGEKGQVVLHAGGARHLISVQEKLGQGQFPLGETGLSAECVGYFATAGLGQTGDDGALHFTERATDGKTEQPAVEIAVFRGDDRLGQLSLLADYPELGQQLGQHEVYGSYWFDHGQKDSAALLAGDGGSRIDIIQSPDGQLAYRYWNRHDVVAADKLPADGTRIDAFKMPMAQLQMYVERHVASPTPTLKYLPVAFNADMTAQAALRAAHVRLTVDGKAEEFWLVGPPITTQEGLVSPNQQRTVRGDRRTVTVTLPLDEIDVGFLVGLNKFERKLDPGTSQASHYSSIVDLLDRDDDGRAFQRQVLITMNAPIDFSSPKSGRSYRLFQESFQGPFAPDDPMYDVLVPASLRQENKPRAMSILTVNHDPGRGVKYVGSLLIVAGIATMFYMRAYFFNSTSSPVAKKPAKKHKPNRAELAAR